MPTGKATRKAKSGLDFYDMRNPLDAVPLMTALLAIGFEAQGRAYKDANGAAAWDLQIVDNRPGADANPQDKVRFARLGDVVVWDPGTARLEIMRIEEFQTDYDVP